MRVIVIHDGIKIKSVHLATENTTIIGSSSFIVDDVDKATTQATEYPLQELNKIPEFIAEIETMNK